jgi:hypothetical protein
MFAGLLIWTQIQIRSGFFRKMQNPQVVFEGYMLPLLTVYGTRSPAWSTLAKLLTYNQIYLLF